MCILHDVTTLLYSRSKETVQTAPSVVSLGSQIGDNMQPGHDAKVNNEAARMAMQAVDDAGIWCIFTNGFYKKIGAAYNKVSNDWAEDFIRKGGEVIRNGTSVGIDLRPMTEFWEDKDTHRGGATLRGQTFKGVGGKMTHLDFDFKAQIMPYLWINKFQEVADLDVKFGVFRDKDGAKSSNGNSTMYFNGNKLCALGKGNATLAEFLAQNRLIAEEAEVKLRECMSENVDYIAVRKNRNN